MGANPLWILDFSGASKPPKGNCGAVANIGRKPLPILAFTRSDQGPTEESRFNAELKIMRSPLVRGSDLMLFPGLFAAHKGAGLEEGDQLIGRLEAPGA